MRGFGNEGLYRGLKSSGLLAASNFRGSFSDSISRRGRGGGTNALPRKGSENTSP